MATGTDGPVRRQWESTADGAHLRGRRTSGTAPELALRRTLHARGLRYRLGKRIGRFRPDVVFTGAKTVLFVDGCYWHGCPTHGPTEFRGPNADKWRAKIALNRERDRTAVDELSRDGWTVVRIWECEIKSNVQRAADRVEHRLHEASTSSSR